MSNNKVKLDQLKSVFYNPNRLQKDGEDHILVSLKGETLIGRVLSPQYSSRISTSVGDFDSARAFWLWILYKGDDRFRLLQEQKILTAVKKEGLNPSFVKDFKSLTLYVKYLQLNKLINPIATDSLINSCNLPLKMYSEDSKTSFKTTTSIEGWWTEGLTEIINTIKLNVDDKAATPKWETIGDKVPMSDTLFVKAIMDALKAS